MIKPKVNSIRIVIVILILLVAIGRPRQGHAGPASSGPTTYCLPKLSELIQQEDNGKALALIELGADVDQTDTYGRTPLIVACAKRRPSYDVIKALIRKEADVNAADHYGSTALGFAVDSQDLIMTELLLKAGADVNRASFIGNTALVMAAENADADWRLLKLLIEHGGDVNRKGRLCSTALMVVSGKGDRHIVQYLLDAGATAEIRDEAGRTALDYARERHRTEVVSILQAVRMHK